METLIERAFISFRIAPEQWMHAERFQELLRLFEEHPGVTDEIALFTQDTHAPLPLSVVARRADLLRDRLRPARDTGLRAGINILTTIGHHVENAARSQPVDLAPMTDSRGNVCPGSFCPNDERVQDYVRQQYELMTRAEPDFLWVDDDVRLFGHKPLIETCFCDHCLRLFARETGQEHDRGSLSEAFDQTSVAGKLQVRRAWLEHNRKTIARLLELIETTVHAVRPGLPLGFMSGERYYEGYDFRRWAEALSGPEKAPVMWRPGGGFYGDERLCDLVGKSHAIGRQVSLLPERVVSIQSEIENFPYQRLKKAAHTTTLEAAAHMGAGATGAAFNVLSLYDEPLDEYRTLVRQIHQARPFYDLLAQSLGRTHPKGIHTGWCTDSFAAVNVDTPNWFDPEFWRMMGEYANEVFELGLPVCYRSADASVMLLTGSAPLALGEEAVLSALSGGVYMDGRALEHLDRMGYAHLAGFGIDRWTSADTIEEFVDDPLNGPFAGRRRDARQSFWECPAAMLERRSAATRILARAVNYAGAELGDCCLGLFENKLGGRICVAGYFPWLFLQNLAKSSQIKAVMRWLARDTLSAYVDSFHRINLWVREPEPGKLAVAVINSCLDPAEDVALVLRTGCEEIDVVDMRCSVARVRSSGHDSDCHRFVLPPIEPWHMRLITAY